MVIRFDFMQNPPLPHIRHNLTFRCRQLWYYAFGVHNLADDKASMYVYTENIAKKCQNEVTSMLFQYFARVLDITSPDLIIFSDGCPGQNKNYVMIHFLYILVHCFKLFESITYIFPMRDLVVSYADKVIVYGLLMVQIIFSLLLIFEAEHPSKLFIKRVLIEDFRVVDIRKRAQKLNQMINLNTLEKKYAELIKLSEKKLSNLKSLLLFIPPEHHGFYLKLGVEERYG
nr:unnamed protein product [Callosobruchus analis]